MKTICLIFSFTFFIFSNLSAQSILDDIDDDQSEASSPATGLDLPIERIEKIGASRTVYILSNSNSSFAKGDFISLVLGDNLVNRAIVAKVSSGSAGIKIIKTYSPEMSSALRPGSQVRIIRGDDSYFSNLKKKSKSISEKSLIDDEDDLFNDTTLLSDDVSLKENSKRLIRTDSLFFAMGSSLPSVNNTGGSTRYNMYGASYSYQFKDNFWVEGYYSFTGLKNFPSTGKSSDLNVVSGRLKYTVKLPSYTFLQPYIGFIISRVSTALETNSIESDAITRANTVKPAIGVTILRRLVPGWFVRGDLGTDLFALGFGLEF